VTCFKQNYERIEKTKITIDAVSNRLTGRYIGTADFDLDLDLALTISR